MARIKYFDEASQTWKHADNVLFVAPVQTVNGKTGTVVLAADDVGAEALGAVATHNTDGEAHGDIRALVTALEGKAMLKSDISVKKAQLTLEDGTTVLIDVVVASEGTTIVAYTNQIPLSIDTDGSIYNGVGYKTGYRLSSSGTEKEVGSDGTGGSIVTGFIPVQGGDVVRIAGVPWVRSNPDNTSDGASNYFAAYDASFALIGSVIGNFSTYYGNWSSDASLRPAAAYTVPDGEITTDYVAFTLASDANIAYVRMCCNGGGSAQIVEPEKAVVTVNEQIQS